MLLESVSIESNSINDITFANLITLHQKQTAKIIEFIFLLKERTFLQVTLILLIENMSLKLKRIYWFHGSGVI